MQLGGDGRQRLLQRAQGAFEFQQVYPLSKHAYQLSKHAAKQVRETGNHPQPRQQLVGGVIWLGKIASKPQHALAKLFIGHSGEVACQPCAFEERGEARLSKAHKMLLKLGSADS
jgi:hypothetical protein